jgi:AhpD family alkylhydroperoxidase
MRLEPIEQPRGLLTRLGYWLSRRQLGSVMSPLKVIYARAPRLAWTSLAIGSTMEKGLSLEPELRLLITTQSSLLNGCHFCADLHMAQAVQARLGLERFKALPEFAASSLFSERERAVLAYTEEVTRRRAVSDAVFESLRKHASEKEIVEITWLNAVGNFYNLMAVPLELESDGFTEMALRHAERRPASLRA